MRLWKSRKRVSSETDIEQLSAEIDRPWTDAVNTSAVKAMPVLRRLGEMGQRPQGMDTLLELARECPDEVPVGLSFISHAEITCGESFASINSVAISPDGTTLATGSSITPPRLWRIPGGEPIAELHDMGAEHLAFSPDGRFLVGISKPEPGPEDGVMVWEMPSGRRLHYLDFHRVSDLALDNTLVVGASSKGDVKVWELVSGELLTTRHVSKLGATRPVISPDGGLLVVTAGGPLHDRPSTTEVWRLPTGEPVTTISSPQVTALTVTEDGLIVGACAGSLRLWHAETGEPAGTLDGNQKSVWEISAGRDVLVAGGFDRTVRIWDRHTKEPLTVREQDERVVHVATTNTMAVTGNLLGIVTWYELPTAASATTQARYNHSVDSLAVTPETTVSGHADGKAVIWQSTLRRAATADEPRFADLTALRTRAPRATGAERAWIDLVLALANHRA